MKKTILLSFNMFEDYQSGFEDCDCFVTEDYGVAPTAHAIIFHLIDLNARDMPKEKPTGQIWVLYNMMTPEQLRALSF